MVPLAAGQNFTTVTGTITDSIGLPYSNASVTAEIQPAGTNPAVPPPCAGQTSTNCGISGLQRATADVNGTFSMTLASNAAIIPGGTQWKFTVTVTPGIPPPAGTGSQSCIATLIISGASQSVTSSFNACPKLSNTIGALQQGTVNPSCSAGQAFQFLNTATNQLLICNNGILTTTAGSPATAIDVKLYGVKADLKYVYDASITNGLQTLTCPNSANNPCVFTSADLTKKEYGISATGAARCPPPGTITAINNAQSIQVSIAATLGAVANCMFAWATDDTAALTAASNAFKALPRCGGAVLFPVGYMMDSLPQFNGAQSACSFSPLAAGEGSGLQYNGQGAMATYIVPSPDFVFNTGIGAGQFFSGSAGTRVQDLSILGLGWNCTTVATGNSSGISVGITSFIERVQMMSWCWTPSDSFTGIRANGPGYYMADSIVDQTGTVGLQVVGGCCNSMFGGWLDNQGAGGNSLSLGGGVTFASHNTQMFGQGNTVAVGANSEWHSYMDVIGTQSNSGVTCIDFSSSSGSRTFFEGSGIGCNIVAGQTAFNIGSATPSIYLHNTAVYGGTTFGAISGTAGTIIDEGGNTGIPINAFIDTNGFTGTWQTAGPQTFTGKGTGVCTASVTIFLFPIGEISARTCTVTTESLLTGQGVVTTPGTLHNLRCTASAAGSAAGSGIVTVRVNGANSTITATFGTTTSAIDSRHFPTVVTGDVVTIQLVTAAAETLANPACQVQVN